MLLAATPKLGRFSEIVPVLIDADETNGSLNRTRDILLNYETLNANFSPSGYFATKIEKLNKNYIHLVNVKNESSSQFKDYIDLNALERKSEKDKDTARLIKLLFSGKSSAGIPLLELNMDEGFQGNPNIGSVVMSDFADKFLSSMPLQSEDEILFITSIFGGTGAAGFPAFLARMRKPTTQARTDEAQLMGTKVGAISLLPYYGLPQAKHQHNGSHFVPKTKSALNYYLGNIYSDKEENALKQFNESDLERLYYIAHEYNANQPKNERGGKTENNSKYGGQDNPAFFAEFMAALAVFDYVADNNIERKKIKFKEIEYIKRNAEDIGIKTGHLDENIENLIGGTLKKLSLMSQFLSKKFLDDAISKKYAWTRNLALSEMNRDEKLEHFMTEFSNWENELKTTGQKFHCPSVNVENIHAKLDQESKHLNGTANGIKCLLEILNKEKVV
ncbi:MAG: hypothetical protein LBU89_12525 [Fibromonadaceae bacterium]|nr:hypothetical protein [Fibromonadaceae bacterium]